MTDSEKTALRRQRYKERIVYVMGGCCQCCGYNKYNGALEFHHIHSEEKSFGLSQKTYYAWSKLESELKKCILVCANCHREIEAGLIKVEKSSFNQEKYDEIKELIEQEKTKTIRYCSECGAEISQKAYLCKDCADKKKQICERPSREELKSMIRTQTFTSIAKQYNVSDNAVKKWCDKYNLPRKKSEIKSYSDKEWNLI